MTTTTVNLHLGQRVVIGEDRATIRWIGELEGVVGTRVGVEWDRPDRGRHNGDCLEKNYFKPVVEGAGSFLKVPSKVCERREGGEGGRKGQWQVGYKLLAAIRERYLAVGDEGEDEEGGGGDRQVPLAYQPKVKIETCGWEKVQTKLSQTESLKVLSVSDLIVSELGTPTELKQVRVLLPALEDLDLSRTLISDWSAIMELCDNYVTLKTVRLDGNRLHTYNLTSELINHKKESFSHLVTLTLNETLISCKELRILAPLLAQLETLHLSTNRFTSIPSPTPSSDGSPMESWFPSLTYLSLTNNLITGLDHEAWSGLRWYPSLQTLDLSFNPVEQFLSPSTSSTTTSEPILSESLTRLSVNYGNVKDWQQFAMLPQWFPNLNHLQSMENPATTDTSGIADPKLALGGSTSLSRILLITMIPNLTQLNMTGISSQERTDAELYYLHQICEPQLASLNFDTFHAIHRQYDRLRHHYGVTPKPDPTPSLSLVKNRFMTLHLACHPHPPPSFSDSTTLDDLLQLPSLYYAQKPFLNSATTRTVHLTLTKLFRLPPRTPLTLHAILFNPDSSPPTVHQIIPLDHPLRPLADFYLLRPQDLIWATLTQ